MKGNLGSILISGLIREIAQKNGNGLLKLTRQKAIKAIFFESGVPVFAISNLSSDQLDQKLVQDGLVSAAKVAEAKSRAEKPHLLPQTLVAMGLITPDAMLAASKGLAKQIILSLFTWDQGEYALDERVRTTHEVSVDWSAADCLLQGARIASLAENTARLLIPEGGVVRPSSEHVSPLASSGKLTPIESYVLSRVEGAMPADQVGEISGLTDEEARVALCALLSVGLLQLDGASESDDRAEAVRVEDSLQLDQLRADINRKLHFFQTADFYDILGVGRKARLSEIKAAYYGLAKKYHPDRFRQGELVGLRSRVEGLFAKVTQAYDTLGDPRKRSGYDDRLKKVGTAALTAEQATTTIHAETVATPPQASPEARPEQARSGPEVRREPSGDLSANAPAAEYDTSAPAASVENPAPAAASLGHDPAKMAEYCFQQARLRNEAKDYFGAVQMFREAVRLDPSKGTFHFHLGVALTRNRKTVREGEQHLVKAAELDRFNPQVRVKLGLLYKEAGRPKKAEAFFREALELDPVNRVALKELGQTSGGGSKAGQPAPGFWKSDLGSIAKKIFKK